jgi:hypothetical protein
MCTAVLIGWGPATPPPPRIWTRITRALLVSKDRRHLFVTPWWNLSVALGIGCRCYCFHQLISQRFSGEHLGSFLEGTEEDWNKREEHFLGANLEDVEDLKLGQWEGSLSSTDAQDSRVAKHGVLILFKQLKSTLWNMLVLSLKQTSNSPVCLRIVWTAISQHPVKLVCLRLVWSADSILWCLSASG